MILNPIFVKHASRVIIPQFNKIDRSISQEEELIFIKPVFFYDHSAQLSVKKEKTIENAIIWFIS